VRDFVRVLVRCAILCLNIIREHCLNHHRFRLTFEEAQQLLGEARKTCKSLTTAKSDLGASEKRSDTLTLMIRDEVNFRVCLLTSRICMARQDWTNAQALLRKASVVYSIYIGLSVCIWSGEGTFLAFCLLASAYSLTPTLSLCLMLQAYKLKHALGANDALEKGVVKLLLALTRRNFVFPRRGTKSWTSVDVQTGRESAVGDALDAWQRLEDCFDSEGKDRQAVGRHRRGGQTKLLEEFAFGYAGFTQSGPVSSFMKKVAVWVVEIIAQMTGGGWEEREEEGDGKEGKGLSPLPSIAAALAKPPTFEKARRKGVSSRERSAHVRRNAIHLMQSDDDKRLLEALFDRALSMYA